MNTIKNLKKHEILVYLIVTFLFTWVFWSIYFASSNGLFRILGAFMPSVMSILFTGYYYGKSGIRDLLKKLTTWKINPLFYVFALFYTAASIYIPSYICTITGFNYKIHISNSVFGFHLNNPITTLSLFLLIMFFGGPLAEELGWRGFVLPKLQKKFNPLISSIILAFIWSCWHLPFFLTHAPGYDINFIIYLIETIWLTILFTWLYNRTNGNLLIVILYHTVDNFVLLLCSSDFMIQFNRYSVILNSLRFIVLLFIIFDMTRKPAS